MVREEQRQEVASNDIPNKEMNSREKILEAVRAGKPEFVPLPIGLQTISTYPNLVQQFAQVLQAIGGTLVRVQSTEEVAVYLQQHYDLTQPVINLVPSLQVGNTNPAPTDDPHQFDSLHLVLLAGQLGVAENAAIWVDDHNFPLRALPFITLNLAIVLSESQLAATMHEAYRKLHFTTGYGTFIAGPSKTADIEQSLVIGAHGPKSMVVFLLSQ